ncbi:MAG: YncE family protein [Gemmatimonadota bacterium]|nr:YncE family protein [Gemmatimonadota bacterium]
MKLAVEFAPEDDVLAPGVLAADGADRPAAGHKRKSENGREGASSVLAAAIVDMDAAVWDASAGGLEPLALEQLYVDFDDSTFSGQVVVEAGSQRVVAVRAYAPGGGVCYLGVERNITVVAGDEVEARITMKSYVPEIYRCDRISQSGDITLAWTPVIDAAGYVVQESALPGFVNYDSVLVAGTSTTTLNGRPPGMRYLRVRAQGDYAGVGAPGDTVSVQVVSAPVLTILSPPGDQTTVQFGQPVLFLVQVLEEFDKVITDQSIAWVSSHDGVFAYGRFVLHSELSLGDHPVFVNASNSFGLVSSDTVVVSVVSSGNLAPAVVLEYPSDSASFNQGQAVLFVASGDDPEQGPLGPDDFYWFSSRDGYFGKGHALEYGDLSLGGHTVIVIGTDGAGAAGTDSVCLSIVSSGANTAPLPEIITPAGGASFPPGAQVLFQGLAEDAEEGLLGNEALVWSSSLDGALGKGAVVVAGGLSDGAHMIYLTAVDSRGAAARDSVQITVAAGADPEPSATITLPLDGSTFQYSTNIRFVGQAGGPVSIVDYVWFCAATGLIGRGQAIESSSLAIGRHLVYLAAVDERGAAGLDSVTVNIVLTGGNQAPLVTITSPAGGTVFTSGESIYLAAAAEDPEEGPLEGVSVIWSSSLDSLVGWGRELFVSSLSEGAHCLKVIAVDSRGAAGVDSVLIQVASSGGIQSPTARIVSPQDNGQFNQGAGILFSAEVTGLTEEQAASGRVWWTSDAAGRFATGLFHVEHGLPTGAQWVYLAAVAGTGAAARDSVRLTVVSSGGNSAPEVTIMSPAASSSWPSAVGIAFLGRAADPEEGLLEGEALQWYSTGVGNFGSGEYFVSGDLPDGSRWVRLVAVDGSGAAGIDSVDITIGGGAAAGNQPPVATIIFPAEGASFAVGTPVLFAGSGADPEEGNLPADRLMWYSSVSGLIGAGDYLLRGDLPEGGHRVVLLAVDEQGLTGSAEVDIRIEPGGNQSPGVTITSPGSGAVFALGRHISFTGTASDPEDGVLPGSALSWSSDIDGVLGTGASLLTDALSAGIHLVVLRAADSHGAGGFDSVSISVSHPPEVTINSPVDGFSYPIGTPIEFAGSAHDPEEGVVPPGALFWRSSMVDGPIGTGASFVLRTLGLGLHRIILVAHDRLGVTDSAMVTIEVVAVPDTVVTVVPVGADPRHVAIDPLEGLAYMTNYGDNTISRIEMQGFTETARISVGSNPIGLAVSKNLRRVYVANTSGNDLSVVEGGAVAQTIPVGFQPMGVAINQDESLVFVSNSNAASVSVISTTTGAVVQTIHDVGNSPGNLLVPPGSNYLFISNYGSRDLSDTSPDEVAVINLLDSTVVARIQVGDKPLGLASTSDGSLVFVANSGSNSVSVISTALLQVLNVVSVGQTPTACAVTPDNNQLYVVGSASADISVVDISSKTVIEVVPGIGLEPYDIAIFDDFSNGRVLALVTDRAGGRLQVLLVR